AWSALLRSHASNVQPVIDRWRGSLDTLLIFVALFSAIVTAFYIQSLNGLSPNPQNRTNELLTAILIALNDEKADTLNLSTSLPFIPSASVVRANFYLSLSLIMSVS
ncbi:uncharacterized protein STEHIDRAFT_31413, partial [Stereum hirsutum FP-91666 SS1]|uniref:uncharacterized protein n=1 Tax=Stereum hirsutum (strain FP-91666) TaxID=721885 RepID=UPI00044100A1